MVLLSCATLCRLAASCCHVNSRSPFAIELDDSVLAAARRGEDAALEAIYRQYQGPCFQLAWRLCGDREQARDLVHDALLKVFCQLHQFRADSPFWAWLRQVLVNECLMHLRRHARGEQEIERRGEQLVEQAADEHLDLPPAVTEQGLLQRAMEQLPPSTRAVLWLYHVEGYTHVEIAALMQRTLSFSKSQLARGTRRLRDLLSICEDTAHV